ncbi:MAG: hypothetical protein IJI37_00385 [Opitutales bacterium]|nr:hypothetical protein [Opitutales bacterium]
MNKALANFFYFLGAVPLLLRLPYLYSSWRGSPFEKYDVFIWLLLAPIAAASEIIRRRAGIVEVVKTYRALMWCALAACLALYALLAFKINAAGIFLGLAILAISTELRFGRRVLLAQLPAFLFASLTIPNLSFWVEYYLHIGVGGIVPFFFAKIAFAFSFFVLWSVRTLHLRRYPRASSIMFCTFVMVAVFCAIIKINELPEGDPLELDLKKTQIADWIGTDMPLTKSDEFLFSDLKSVSRKIYFGANSQIAILAVEVKNISEIHPVEICLKTSDREIESSTQTYVRVNGKNIQLNEVIFMAGGRRFAVYSIFSNGKASTGFFTKFRLSPDKAGWRHYQIQMPLDPSDRDARADLKRFLSAADKRRLTPTRRLKRMPFFM